MHVRLVLELNWWVGNINKFLYEVGSVGIDTCCACQLHDGRFAFPVLLVFIQFYSPFYFVDCVSCFQ